MLEVPTSVMKAKLMELNVMKIKVQNSNEVWQAVYRGELAGRNDLSILDQYNGEIRGLHNLSIAFLIALHPINEFL